MDPGRAFLPGLSFPRPRLRAPGLPPMCDPFAPATGNAPIMSLPAIVTPRALAPGGLIHERSRTLTLPNGRVIGFLELGDPAGPPVFFFHGFPGSRLQPAILPVRGVRIISVDRPGYGISDPYEGRTLADWPMDVAAIADRLGIDKFCVLGVSGGAPYAAACAHDLADRVRNAVIVCGLGPPDAPGMAAAHLRLLRAVGSWRDFPREPVLNFFRNIAMTPFGERLNKRMRALAPKGSKEWEALSPEFASLLRASWAEGLRLTTQGMISDAEIYGTAWHFDVNAIRVPMAVWHGSADATVPVSVGHFYAAHCSSARGHFPTGEGHFSLVRNYIDRIVASVAAESADPLPAL